jgi:hypothetical protein
MRWDPTDADSPQSHPHTEASAAKRARRPRALASTRPAGQHAAATLLASFATIATLLLFWAVAVTL